MARGAYRPPTLRQGITPSREHCIIFRDTFRVSKQDDVVYGDQLGESTNDELPQVMLDDNVRTARHQFMKRWSNVLRVDRTPEEADKIHLEVHKELFNEAMSIYRLKTYLIPESKRKVHHVEQQVYEVCNKKVAAVVDPLKVEFTNQIEQLSLEVKLMPASQRGPHEVLVSEYLGVMGPKWGLIGPKIQQFFLGDFLICRGCLMYSGGFGGF